VRSLRVLTLLLAVLVLVPAGILAWLGGRGAAAWEEATRARIEAEIEDGRSRLRQAIREEGAALERGLAARLGVLAVAAKTLLPARGIPDGMMAALARLPPASDLPALRDVRLEGAAAKALWPVPFDPDRPASDLPRDRLAFDLAREADRLRFGGGGAAAAAAFWREVAAKAPGGGLEAWARAREALVRGGDEPLAGLRTLERGLGEVERAASARPRMRRLLLAADGGDRAALEELARRWREGLVAAAPLTPEERRRGARLLRRGGVEGAVPPALLPVAAGEGSSPLRADLGHGAALVARVGADALRADLARRVAARPWGRLVVRVLAPGEAVAGRETGAVPGPLGVTPRYVVDHLDEAAFEAGRHVRRALTFGGVGALLALMVVGLLLVRRAVVRERAAGRLRDAFVANVSHELRTPLASVLLHTDLLAEGTAAPEKRARLARVVRAEGARLAALVEDLLDFEALTQGRRRLESEPMDLGAAVREAVLPYETLAEREGVALAVDAPAGEVGVFADPHATSRILANLLSNAWRHGRPSRDGSPGRLRVRLVAEGDGSCVEVADDGPGIPAGERDAVFDRFRRGSGATSVRGTGLGLALSRELARAMGGSLRLAASDGETVFVLRLPGGGAEDGTA
jgi:signal transduction histidine kinase